jgi:hypothetical protein
LHTPGVRAKQYSISYQKREQGRDSERNRSGGH